MTIMCPHCGEPITNDQPVTAAEGQVCLERPWLSGPHGQVRLQDSQADVVEPMLRAFDRFVHSDALYNACYGLRNEQDMPTMRLLYVQISKLRGRIACTGLAIENRWGFGFRLTLQ